MRLTTRLALALAAATLVVFAIVGFVSVRSTRNSLIAAVDGQLADALAPISEGTADQGSAVPAGPRPGQRPASPVQQRRFAVVDIRDGEVGEASGAGGDASVPDLSGVDFDRVGGTRALPSKAFTVPALDGSGDFRVVVGGNAESGVAVALPLDEVDDTVRRLGRVLLLIGSLTGIALVGSMVLIVRRQTRPIEAVATTARRGQEGDLSVRADERGGAGEVAALASAFNGMLDEIEADVAERVETEARLRQFIADASHELRTPVTSIQGYAELYRSGALADEAELRRAMARVESEGGRMARLIEDLLSLVRLDRSPPTEPQPVDLAAIAKNAVADASVSGTVEDISYEGAESAIVSGNADRLHQVIANLIANAGSHAADAPVVVSLTTAEGAVIAEVRDGGPGMTGDQVAHAFDRFWRADVSRARSSGGSGLGLAIVAAIVEAHGGTVSIESAPGNGTTVRVEVPTSR